MFLNSFFYSLTKDVYLTESIMYAWAENFNIANLIDKIYIFSHNVDIHSSSYIVSQMITRTIIRPMMGEERRIWNKPLPMPWDLEIDNPYPCDYLSLCYRYRL